TASKIAIGAIKYSLLKSAVGKDTIFDIDQSISLEGNSGPYLQYSLVRCFSVLNKNKKDFADFKIMSVSKPEEQLLRKLSKFYDQKFFTEDFSQHNLCTYLYELASIFNIFYEKCPILKGENREFRLSLVMVTSKVLV